MPPPGWTAWRTWNWCDPPAADYERRQRHAGWCGDHLVGFLHVWADFPSVHQPGKQVLYVEHLAAAPGNLVTELWVNRYSDVGSALLAYSFFLSRQQGFEGRVGLHAADEQSLPFYRHLHARYCASRLWHPERNEVVGPTPHSRPESDGSRVYLESTEEGALAWLGEYRSG